VIEFSVTDAGPGLKEEVVGRLYEAFFSTKAEGLGIGLNLCRSIVESHQGRMRAQNLYNGPSVAGCTFSFTLPLVSIGLDEGAPVASAGAPASSTTPTITLS
jgi:signal transduction histidine kinase